MSRTHLQSLGCALSRRGLNSYCFRLRSAPPSRPPAELQNAYTMEGRVPLEFYYVDDSNKGKGELLCVPIKWKRSRLKIISSRHTLQVFTGGHHSTDLTSRGVYTAAWGLRGPPSPLLPPPPSLHQPLPAQRPVATSRPYLTPTARPACGPSPYM